MLTKDIYVYLCVCRLVFSCVSLLVSRGFQADGGTAHSSTRPTQHTSATTFLVALGTPPGAGDCGAVVGVIGASSTRCLDSSCCR